MADFDPVAFLAEEDGAGQAPDFDPVAFLAEDTPDFDPVAFVEGTEASKGLLDSALSLTKRLGYGAAMGTIGVTKATNTLINRPFSAFLDETFGGNRGAEVEKNIQTMNEAQQNISQSSQAEGGGATGDLVEAVGGALPSLAVQIPASASAFLLSGGNPAAALWTGSIIGGAQSGAGTYEDAKASYIAQGDTPESASEKAIMPAMASAAVTGLITRVFGTTGVESIFRSKGANAVKDSLVKVLVKQGLAEGAEESIDQAVQSAVQMTTYNPNLTFEDALKQTLLAGGAGAIIGGGVSTAFAAVQPKMVASKVGPATAATVDQLGQVSPEITARVNELRAAREGRVGEANIAAEAALVDAETLLSQPSTPEPSDVTTQAQAPTAETPAISTAEDVSPIAWLPGAVQPIQLGGEEQPTGGVLTPVPDFSVVLPDAPEIAARLTNAWSESDKNVPLSFTRIDEINGSGGLGLYSLAQEDGTSILQIDPKEIAQFSEKIGDPEEAQNRITRALSEEGLHAQDVKALHKAWQEEGSDKPFLTHLNEFWNGVSDEMTPVQRELVNKTYLGDEKFNAGERLPQYLEGAEFLRMLLQEDITGTLSEGGRLGVTRDQLAPSTALGRILRIIQRFFDPNVANNQLAARHFDRVKALVGEAKAQAISGLKFNGEAEGISMFTEEDPDSPAQGGTFAIEGEVTPEKVQAARQAQNERFSTPVSTAPEAAQEASAQLREKSFIARQRANSYVEDTLKLGESITPEYEVVANAPTRAKARADNNADANAMATVLDPKSGITPLERQARGIDLYETYTQAAKQAEADGDIEAANALTDQARAIANGLDEMGREYGRAVQIMNGRMTPRGWEREYNRQIRKATEPLRKSIQTDLDELQATVEVAKEELPKKPSFKKSVKSILDSVKGLAASSVGVNTTSKPDDTVLVDIVAKIAIESNGDAKVISERLVNEAGLSKSKADAIAGRLVEAAKAEIAQKTQAYLDRLVKNSGKKKVARAMKSSMDKIIDLSLKGGLTQEAVWNAVAEKLGLPAYDPATAREIQRQAEAIQNEPKNQKSPIAKGRAINNLANFIAQKTGLDKLEVMRSYWYAAVLSGMGTQATNFFNTMARTATETFVTATDLAAVQRDPQAAIQVIKGYLSGFSKSIPAFQDALFKGDFTGQYSFEAQRALNALEQIPTDAGRFIKILSNAKYVSRLMAATDIFNATAAAESRARLLAYQKFKKAGVSASEINRAIDEALGATPEQLKAAQLQAEMEGYNAKDAKRRVTEILEQIRPSGWTEDARSYGLSSTFNDPKPKGVVGMFASGIEQMFNTIERAGDAAGRTEARLASRVPRIAMMPFIRIVANVTNDYINYTPLAAYRFFRAKNFLGPNATANDVRLLQGKILAGNMILISVAARLALEDLKDEEDRDWDIVGNGPKDPDQRKQWLAAGNKPWSLQIKGDNGKKVNIPYIYTPMGMAFAMLGSYRDAQKYATEKDPSLTMKLAGAAMNGAFVLSDMSFLQGVQNIFQLLDKNQSPESFARRLAGTPAKIIGGLNPNILKEVSTYFSPEIPDTKTAPNELAAIFAREWPVLRQTVAGEPQLNVLGEPVKVYKWPWDRFYNQQTPSEQWKLLGELQGNDVFVPFSSSQNKRDLKTGARNVRMDGQELYAFYEKRGEYLKQYLTPQRLNSLVALSNTNPNRAQDELNKIVTAASDRAKGVLGF